MKEGEWLHWKGEIFGPKDTPYEGGKFVVDIVLPNDYPFVPPKVCQHLFSKSAAMRRHSCTFLHALDPLRACAMLLGTLPADEI